jgi:hypothetical protein
MARTSDHGQAWARREAEAWLELIEDEIRGT